MADCDVVIVGGGPVGLALAAELGWRGRHCLVVEQRPADAESFPTANHISIRTMEHLRRWGIADCARFAGFPADFPTDKVFVTGVGAYELCRFEGAANGSQERAPYSPETSIWCPKPFFDPVLEKFVRSMPCIELRHGWRLDRFEQTPSAVIADVVESEGGRRRRVEAAFLVGCDGAGGRVRELAGIERPQWNGSPGAIDSMVIRSPDLARRLGRQAVQHWIVNRDLGSPTIVSIDGKSLWRIHALWRDRARPSDPARWLRSVIGNDAELVDRAPWAPAFALATTYRSGRVFIAGDAAHLATPYGGLNMNTGIHDAVDLGWKMAGVLEGWGADGLLDSYVSERRAAAARLLRYQGVEIDDGGVRFIGESPLSLPDVPEQINDAGPDGDEARATFGKAVLAMRSPEFHNVGIDLGTGYPRSPVCVPDDQLPPEEVESYTPTASPGHRAPHAWLEHDRSTLDCFGEGFTLLRMAETRTSPLDQAATKLGVPMAVVEWKEPPIRDLYERDLALVRPDGVVAWRGDQPPSDADHLMEVVTGRR